MRNNGLAPDTVPAATAAGCAKPELVELAPLVEAETEQHE